MSGVKSESLRSRLFFRTYHSRNEIMPRSATPPAIAPTKTPTGGTAGVLGSADDVALEPIPSGSNVVGVADAAGELYNGPAVCSPVVVWVEVVPINSLCATAGGTMTGVGELEVDGIPLVELTTIFEGLV